jgi:glycosyltransferase involved in cell wall biosynthesis
VTRRDRPLRVLHLLPQPFPLGGAERTVLDLLASTELAPIDQRVAFVRAADGPAFPSDAVLARGATGPAGAVLRFRPDVLHSWLLVGNVAGAALKLLRPGARLVTSERNMGTELTPAGRRLEHLVARAEDVATANSLAVAEGAIARVPRRARRMEVIPPGVDAPPRPADVRPSTAVMVGRLHPIKDYALALRAWAGVRAAVPDASLAIVGDGPERSRLLALRRELGLEDAVEIRGDGPVGPHLYGAEIFLSTSRAEGFSRALLEALAAGLPAVSTAVGGAREIPEPAVRLVEPGDEAGLVTALVESLRATRASDRPREAAREVAHRYSRRRCHRQYHDLYRRFDADGPGDGHG